jgi:hypothetical protein
MFQSGRHVALWAIFATCGVMVTASSALAQGQTAQEHVHTSSGSAWQFMQDGIVFVELNHQGGSRGGTELVAPNWWMGMASRNTSRGRLTFNTMFSLDPATVGKDGYREILQSGEALSGQPIVDRQHPHDFFMQLAAVWQMSLTDTANLTVVGAPVGAPALGPVAFMHRASAADNPAAPLGHHTFDSTHVAFGVLTAAVDQGPWMIEGSVFNGREPDDNRWNFDFGRLDSFSGRVRFRPTDEWAFQVSSGHLVEPEALEPGNIVRSTMSISWTRRKDADLTAVTGGYGRNDTDHGARNAAFVEGARHVGANGLYGRIEAVEVETALLQTALLPSGPSALLKDVAFAFTVGIVRDVLRVSGFEGALGTDVALYGIPSALQSAYGNYPLSVHLFFRLRPPVGPAGRMWNMSVP